MSGKDAKNINKFVGVELEHLLEQAQKGFVITREEALRTRKNFDMRGSDAVKARMCVSYNYGALKECKSGTGCKYLHLVHKEEMDESESSASASMRCSRSCCVDSTGMRRSELHT